MKKERKCKYKELREMERLVRISSEVMIVAGYDERHHQASAQPATLDCRLTDEPDCQPACQAQMELREVCFPLSNQCLSATMIMYS